MSSLALSARLGAGRPASLPAKVRSILRKYNGTAIIPGASGTAVYGFAPGNYVESTGQTLSAVDGKVGLVVDAAGSVGPELVTGNNLSGFTDSRDTTHTNASFTTVTGAKGVLLSGLVVNKTYEIVVSGSTTSAEFSVNTADAEIPNTRTLIRTGFGRAIFKADYTYLYLRHSDAATSSNISISVRELHGIHALQATDGYKPIERRGLVNLLTYSNDFGNAVWGKNSVSVVKSGEDNVLTTSSSNHSITFGSAGVSGVSVQPGSQYTFAFMAKRGTMTNAKYSVFNITGLANIIAPTSYYSGINGSDYQIVVVNFTTPAGCTQVGVYPLRDSVATGTSYLHSAALFQGTVTAQQIIDAGGIPVTTGKPASSAKGANYLEFDGADDRLQLSAVPFQMADDHWVVVAAKADTDPTIVRTMFGQSANTNDALPRLALVTGKKIQYYAAGGGTSIFPEISCQPTEPFVASARKIANIVGLRVNGEGSVTGTLSGTYSTAASAGIGSNMRATAGEFLNGKIHAVFFGKGAITDAELLTLEKFAASLQGRTIYNGESTLNLDFTTDTYSVWEGDFTWA